ncbi:MAG TPA: nodulation protein NfeD [Actinomycetota bacterium]|nr:nodulation protein NfeD [Actinomycetota bacterium]
MPLRLRRQCAALVATLLAGSLILIASPSQAQESAFRTVDLVEVRGLIDPPMAGYLQERLRGAEDDGVHALIIQLDTPGGLDVAMRDIVQAITNSTVPVVVWIAPRGAQAASAGTFIAYAGHLTFAAQDTVLGAATPLSLSSQPSPVLERKLTSNAAGYLQELARTRSRNANWAESAVRDAATIGATKAAEIDVVDGIASTLGDLLETLDSQEVEVTGSEPVVLDTWDEEAQAPNVTIRFQGLGPIERLLHAVTSPEVAFLLLLVGTFGLIFEIYNPGIGLAGILGAVALILGFYALSVLPTNWMGVLLIVAAVGLLVIDLHTGGLGVLTVGGFAALVVGGLILFSGAPPALRLSLWAVAAAVALTALFFISVMTAALRVRLRRPISGEEAMVGKIGEAKTDIAPEGTVLSKGTLWRARTMETGIAAGSQVKVMATEGLVLLVEPLHEVEDQEAAPSVAAKEER